MMLGIVATPLSAQQTYTPGVTVEKNTNQNGKQTIQQPSFTKIKMRVMQQMLA